ncbi:hypothetical protein [Pontibacter silvestris]|uniref:hypothetical protein n=1 Tax=Pontibacter silvestris TaxID=2305183 RepID=UPI001E52CF3D|nr:hypothetical protein [Pontibacter silvestris]MCC9135969.1 hypothetical protein [Pontibacter silvestris]
MEKTNETIKVFNGSGFDFILVEAYQKKRILKIPEMATKLMTSSIGLKVDYRFSYFKKYANPESDISFSYLT